MKTSVCDCISSICTVFHHLMKTLVCYCINNICTVFHHVMKTSVCYCINRVCCQLYCRKSQGLSGRTLRKLPFMAHALFIQVRCQRFIETTLKQLEAVAPVSFLLYAFVFLLNFQGCLSTLQMITFKPTNMVW